jgi:hypothetical protein
VTDKEAIMSSDQRQIHLDLPALKDGVKWFNRIDWYVLERINLFWNKKKNRRLKHARIGEIITLTIGKLVKIKIFKRNHSLEEL